MNPISLHNTLTRQKEVFEPIDANNIRMYVCGPTVYDFAHLGNARPIVVFDTLYRLLKRHYPHVTYVRNITDVDDKIMDRARENGEPIDALTTRTTQIFHEDMTALNALPPDIEPRATKYIPQMIAMIKTLITKGHAYTAEGHVLFHVPSMENYGELSRRSRDELVAGARIDVAPYKQDAADFVLWKPSHADQVGWDSPWGRGRPGWHIECSAMSEAHLGETFDIHGGGLDLIFPHHENEIAQSRCAHDGAPVARYWMHNGFLTINNDKMSKSLKNFFTVRELLAEYPGEALRLTLLSSHYRSPADFSIEGLKAAKATLDKWYRALLKCGPQEKKDVPVQPYVHTLVEKALSDDLNTSLAITCIEESASLLNASENKANRAENYAQLVASGQALGLLTHDPEAWFKWQPAGQTGLSDSEIESQIAARAAAKQAKNYGESDRIRESLAAQGVILEDSAGKTTWRRGS